jgi:hypothetical protein
MGEVYRAYDNKLEQPVALKFLPAAMSQDGAALARFHNEVRTARQVSHPNVCRVYDIGEWEGMPFLSMEYVDGEDLASLLRRIGRLPSDKAWRSPAGCARRWPPPTKRRPASRLQARQHHDRRPRPGADHRFRPGGAGRAGNRSGGAATARQPTWLPSNSRAKKPACAATFTHWGWCSTRCSPAGAHLRRSRAKSCCAWKRPARRPPIHPGARSGPGRGARHPAMPGTGSGAASRFGAVGGGGAARRRPAGSRAGSRRNAFARNGGGLA